MNDVIRENFVFKKLTNLYYIHGLLKYPDSWPSDLDLFQYVKPEYLELLKNKKCFFIFDASTEGFSSLIDYPFFEILYNSCKKNNVDPSQIIFISSNLYDESNIEKFHKERNFKKINVFSFVAFEYAINHQHGFIDTTAYLEEKIKIVNNEFKDKYFSSLSRLNRPHRARATFLLCQEEIKNKALISHDKIDLRVYSNHLREFDNAAVEQWSSTLPLTIDRGNFEVNWALDSDYAHIHDQTLFQIVNETEANNRYNTALFYSEKTFRPIAQLQPFVIYGQQYCNRYLKSIGYNSYEDWFDYSFDSEPDDTLRYKMLLNQVKDLCARLDSFTKDQKIEWRFQNKEKLVENYNILFYKTYSKKKMFQFLVEFTKLQSK